MKREKQITSKEKGISGKKTEKITKTKLKKEIELYDLETVDANLDYTRKFNSVVDKNITGNKINNKKEKSKKKKLTKSDIIAIVCGLFYLLALILLILGLIKYFNTNNIRNCAGYFAFVIFLATMATLLISIDFKNDGVKTLLGATLTNKISKKKRVKEYLKEASFISLVITTFVALYIAIGELFIDFYQLTSNVALNVILIFILLYVILLLVSYVCCYLYSEYKLSIK